MPDAISLFAQGTHVLMLPAWLELAAVVVGSLSGSLVAIERQLDLTGCVALSLICGLGGGLIRDVIMQEGDVYMLNSTAAIVLCVVAGAIVFHFPTALRRVPNAIEWADILSVGLFCAAGVNKALMYGLGGVQAVLMGVITGVGGGMLRDVFFGRRAQDLSAVNELLCRERAWWLTRLPRVVSLLPRHEPLGCHRLHARDGGAAPPQPALWARLLPQP